MTYRNRARLLVGSVALALTACGGGGGDRIASIPPPPSPTPSPTPTPMPIAGPIIPGITTSQQFATKGATIVFDQPRHPTSPRTDDSSQLHIRFDAARSQYEVQLPNSMTWQGLFDDPSSGLPNQYSTGGSNPTLVSASQYAATGYRYSALASWGWGRTDNVGSIAFGVATPTSGVPVTGSATYAGQIAGHSTEMVPDFLSGPWPAFIDGSVSLSFDFGAGTLSGSISPILRTYSTHDLPSLTFSNTVYSTGSATFSGAFATNLPGANSFSGQFTGPNAQELIGSFAFPYTSPIDGKPYEAGGGFVAKRPGS